jgi:hypothetical protein
VIVAIESNFVLETALRQDEVADCEKRLSVSEEDRSAIAPLAGTLSRCSKDDHFRSLALVRGAPPKVVWLQVGNASTSHAADVSCAMRNI